MKNLRILRLFSVGLLGILTFSIVYRSRRLDLSVASPASAAPLIAGPAPVGGVDRRPSRENSLQGLRNPVEGTSGTQDFRTRCAAGGVLVCQGWDSHSELIPGVWPNTGLYRGWDKVFHGTIDTRIKASGKGSLRFEILPFSEANVAGQWVQRFGRGFGENSRFYVQYRLRLSPEMLTTDWEGAMGTNWKQSIFYYHDSNCAQTQLVTRNKYINSGIPMMYTECGARLLIPRDEEPPLLQQGEYECYWGDPRPRGRCLFYLPDEWMTFYYEVSIGNWGKPNSSVRAWVAFDGQPFKLWIDLRRFTLNDDSDGVGFDTLTLTNYMTNKRSTASHPTAYTWYDDLIVSSQPIALPASSTSLAGDSQKSPKSE